MKCSDLFRLDGKIALVTGGSRGIGLGIAEGLGEMGASVAITARKAHELEAAKNYLSGLGIEVLTIVADLADPQSVAPLVDQVLDRFGTIDILVNNAGNNWIAPAEDYPDSGYERVMNLNIGAPFRLTREVGKRVMLPKKSGVVINIGSTAATQGNGTGKPGGSHFIGYHAAKGALHSFTRGLAVEWGSSNIRVNTLSPGFIETEKSAAYQNSVRAESVPLTPLRRYGRVEEIKGVAAFLASNAASFITGQTITVDGGITIN